MTTVLKFGGASVATPDQFSSIADLIVDKQRECDRLVIVVSAMQGVTDSLINLAKQVHPSPPEREYDMLVSVGERVSMSLLAMAIKRKNRDAISLTGSQAGIITCPSFSSARIVDVRPGRIESGLSQGKIVIVAGFQGMSQEREITTLGRGGSDTTAVALAIALGAEKVEFYKDVEGVCNNDPKTHPRTTCFPQLTYERALDIVNKGAKILHPRAIALAAKNDLLLHVRSFLPHLRSHPGTLICDKVDQRRASPIYEE